MNTFESRISEIEQSYTALDDTIRQELRGTQEALQAAQERVRGLETRYQVEVLKGGETATRLKIELEVARDAVGLLTEMASQLEAELQTGELVEAQMRRHEAVCEAVENQGNVAIAQAIQAAEQARDAYRQALDAMVETQHRVAATARKSYTRTAKLGRPLDTPVLVRYSASEFPIPEPAESASAASFL